MHKFIFCVSLWLSFALISWSHAQINIGDPLGLSPHWDWKNLETEHFRITFPAQLGPQAQKSAGYFEEAHQILTKKFYWVPNAKTQILVIDNSDLANGLTTPFQRFGIVLMVTPPESWFSTSYYDDWFRLLVFHEYTHFVNMDTTRGVWEVLRYAFGDLLLPNSIWPSWMLEGLAVYMETSLTRAGRGRSPLYEGILRSAVENQVLDSAKFITLDKVNGGQPYFPSGEIAYLFGYQLMNQVAKDPKFKTQGSQSIQSNDKDSWIDSGEDVLGQMSYRSGNRFPFFINGNLENLTSRDWYSYWDSWVQETQMRMSDQLAKIKALPLSKITRVGAPGSETLGTAISPNGQWLAYGQSSEDEVGGIYLRNLKTDQILRVTDKVYGVGLSFTPDSRTLIFNSVHRKSKYYTWSDLSAYDLESNTLYDLTDSLRAKDPSVSSDGTWIVFSQSHHSSLRLMIARLEKDRDRYHLGEPTPLFEPGPYDTASNPKFGPGNHEVFFAFHKNGNATQEILGITLNDRKLRTVIQNGSMNRFPVFDSEKNLCFISDLSGVDNLYCSHGTDGGSSQIKMMTNVTTGLWHPSWNGNQIYAGVLNYRGWILSKVEPLTQPAAPQAVQITKAPAPDFNQAENKASPNTNTLHEVNDYSIFPSIWPRQWAPLLFVQPDGYYLGGQVFGFDAVDRHRYLATLAYDTQVKKLDWLGLYSNRSLGPNFTLIGSQFVSSSTYLSNQLLNYERKLRFSAQISYDFQWTYSNLTPSVSASAERHSFFDLSQTPELKTLATRYVPYFDGSLSYAEAKTSRLAVTTERGRRTVLASRYYLDQDLSTWKALFLDTEFVKLVDHWVLVPQIQASYVNHRTPSYLDSNVKVSGRLNRMIESMPSSSLDELPLRGYPRQTFYTRSVAIPSLDLRFPVARLFRGLGTNPVFFDNLYGFVFGEAGYFLTRDQDYNFLPAVGAGLRLSTELLVRIPLIFSLEYHRGLEEQAGGLGQVFFGINLGAFEF